MTEESRHSVKVPRLFKIACKIAKILKEEGGSVKELVYSSKHPNIKALYALVVETLQHEKQLNRILEHSKILQQETKLDPWLARVLITELLWGKKRLSGESKPVKTILSYQSSFITDVEGNDNARIQTKDSKKGGESADVPLMRYSTTAVVMGNVDNIPSSAGVTDCPNQSAGGVSSQSNSEIASALSALFLYSLAMFTLPIGAYFGVRHVLWYELGVQDFANTFWSVMSAVIVVNVIIASYALRAFREEEKTAVSKNIKVN